MTTSRGRYIEEQTWSASRSQRVSDWYEDLLALQSLIEFQLGLRRRTEPLSPSASSVLLFNAWDTEGPWLPPGRLDLAGEYLEALMRGVTGSAQTDLLAAISVPTSEATAEERELALDIRATIGATRGT